ncbi:MAG TPA: hypothetical protein VFU35_11380, partial [Jatrophihabitans sp.]|nr:hypothetical protein [Jatrophihabitans sp.]
NVPAPAANDNRKLLNKIRTTAQIRYGPAQARSARLVAYYLPGSTLVPTASKSPVVIVSLGTGYRSVASQATVAAQLKRDHVVAGTPAPIASGSCASSS